MTGQLRGGYHDPNVAPRLKFRIDASVRTMLDGAWWPRSRDPVTELVNLVTALDARDMAVTRIMLNPDSWDSQPRRVGVSGRIVRVGWFTTLDPNLLIATTNSEQRVDLLVLSPDTPNASAAAAMTMAADGGPGLSAPAILAAIPAHIPAQPLGQPFAEAVWESEGGRVNGDRSGRPSR